jgi:hypothetical protein
MGDGFEEENRDEDTEDRENWKRFAPSFHEEFITNLLAIFF